ncbi:MAG: hypothetical protein C0177_00320 [Fervidicoccus fontis]|uniref:DUF711 family protein n=1 Tax=Fervidicoccus fontis TaxID=683846 RepID=A0A7C2ZR93_9CREN|nr:MAG: hypothetical protein C0177_00320 [Fervidicoccus fontis]HEW63698.1 DUF711 family protein [Fervidicoccus fontis]
MRIRALTLHLNLSRERKEEEALKNAVSDLYSAKEKIEKEIGLEVWSLRVSIPINWELSDSSMDVLKKEKEIKAVIYTSTSDLLNEEKVFRAVSRGYNAGIFLRSERDLSKILDLIYNLSLKDPAFSTRFAVEMSGLGITTPYFPLSIHDSSVKEDYFSIALLYPKDVEGGEDLRAVELAIEKAYRSLSKFIREGIGKKKLRGIDYSLSPWMEESVGRALEKIGRCKLSDLKCMKTVYEVNSILSDFASKHEGLGFNEIMLPLGEDSYLMSLALNGELTIKDLLLLSYVCVAGMDMIPVRGKKEQFEDLLRDIYAVARVKRRPYGVRLIYINEDFKDKEVNLGDFGKAPILNL